MAWDLWGSYWDPWSSSDDEVPSGSTFRSEFAWQHSDFYFGYGHDLFEEVTMNEKSCRQVMILKQKVDTNIGEPQVEYGTSHVGDLKPDTISILEAQNVVLLRKMAQKIKLKSCMWKYIKEKLVLELAKHLSADDVRRLVSEIGATQARQAVRQTWALGGDHV